MKPLVVYLKSGSAAGRKDSAAQAAAMTDTALGAEHKAARVLLRSINRRVQVLKREIGRRK
jgi:hypothetical protein